MISRCSSGVGDQAESWRNESKLQLPQTEILRGAGWHPEMRARSSALSRS
jgi:hypothetical protein